ncbi:MAG TPA: phage protease [Verrucomicrobiae bacterium]|nr:phage protease [Verrucomicrobiae bacterium]
MAKVTSSSEDLKRSTGWIHIVPKGVLPNGEAGIDQVLDDAALDSIISNLNKDKARLGDKWPGLYAGREHWIYKEDKSSEALAWFKTFEKRADGIWAKDDGLTDLGREAINNRHYKYTSFTLDPQDVQHIKGKQYRVLRIDTVGFTNQANGKELLTPINNRLAESVSQPHNVATLEAGAIQDRAFELQKQNPGLSLASAFCRASSESKTAPAVDGVRNRAADLQRSNPGMSLATAYSRADGEARSVMTPDRFAAALIQEEIRADKSGMAPSMALAVVCNRHPRLARMANREVGWEVLSDLEPAAHAAYSEAVQLPAGDAAPAWRWSKPLDQIQQLRVQNPDLGFEGLYQLWKEQSPEQFWAFVLSCDPNRLLPKGTPAGEPLVYSKSDPSEEAQAWLDACADARNAGRR